MAHHLVLGAGGIGRSTAAHLVSRGHTVTLVSRSGQGAPHVGADLVAADASDVDRLTTLARGASSIVNAVNPPKYTTWDTDWPPVAAAILVAAQRSGAGLVTVSNLYAYGQVSTPMREDLPLRPHGHKGELRARMWRDALALHEQGRISAVELRASDYFGPGAQQGTSILNELVIKRVAAGKAPLVPMGRPDAAHSWIYLDDIGSLAASVAATPATNGRVWGRAWHVPSAPARTLREVTADVAAITGQRTPAIRVLPRAVGTALGTVVPLLRELRETRHQFERPFILDSSAAETMFQLAPTAWEVALKATVDAL